MQNVSPLYIAVGYQIVHSNLFITNPNNSFDVKKQRNYCVKASVPWSFPGLETQLFRHIMKSLVLIIKWKLCLLSRLLVIVMVQVGPVPITEFKYRYTADQEALVLYRSAFSLCCLTSFSLLYCGFLNFT